MSARPRPALIPFPPVWSPGSQRPAPGRGAASRLVAAGACLALTATLGACNLQLGHATPATLPSASAAEAARDRLARQAITVAQVADAVASSHSDKTVAGIAASVATSATELESQLGGVWQPWPSGAPSQAPTVAPTPSAPPSPAVDDLMAALSDGVDLARTAASQASPTAAPTVAGVAVVWSVQASSLAAALGRSVPETVQSAPRTRPTPAPAADLLAAYDQARYALEEIAARAEGQTRERATHDAAQVTTALAQVADASQSAATPPATPAADTRLPAYAAPTGASSQADVDAAWARQVWLAVCTHEVAAAAQVPAATSATPRTGSDQTTASPSPATGAQEDDATGVAVAAAVDAATHALTWGASEQDVLAALGLAHTH